VTARPREAGFGKDADQLIRRLSLVTFLLARRGNPVTVDEIRRVVEGYSLMTDEAFKRRFYEDRGELRDLGICIETASDRNAGELCWLPADAYYLPPLQLSDEELAALGACLAALEERFSYSEPLRLALVALAGGRTDVLDEAGTPPLAVDPEDDVDRAVLARLQQAVNERKTVRFDYYAISRDETAERVVDPYGLVLVSGDWYLVGRCHARDDVRVFKLARIRSRVRHATRAPHDFVPPADFDLERYRDRPAWQLGEPRGEATVHVAPSLAWWVVAHYGHCGRVEEHADGSVTFVTPFAEARPLLSWVLGLGDAAEVMAPVALRARLSERLALLERRLARPPAVPDGAAPPPPGGRPPGRRGKARDWRVTADHFTRLVTLATALLRRCAGGEADVPLAEICRELGMTPEEVRTDVRLLNLVNFAGGGTVLYAEFSRDDLLRVTCDPAGHQFTRPARLSPLQADALLLAVDLLEGLAPQAGGEALRSAAGKLRALRARPPLLAAGEVVPEAGDVLAAVNRAVAERRVLAIEYWAEGTDRFTRREVEPHLLVNSRGEWYYVCWCRRAQGIRIFRVATTKAATLLEERFTPRPEVEVDVYRREGIPTSAEYAPRAATVWYSPVVRRWVEERQPVTALPDGACLAAQPYVDERWLAHRLLRLAGEALPLAPEAATEAFREAVAGLRERYRG